VGDESTPGMGSGARPALRDQAIAAVLQGACHSIWQ